MILVCKQCGNKEKIKKLSDAENFSITMEADNFQPTICSCNNCGHNGILENFILKEIQAATNVGAKTSEASDDELKSVETIGTRNVVKKYRKKPEKRIVQKDSEDVRGTVAMRNPFIKKQSKKNNWKKSQNIKILGNFIMKNPFVKKSELSNNPFVKTAREFKRSPWGKFMKNLAEDNMSYPENPPNKNTGKSVHNDKGNDQPKGQSKLSDPYNSKSGAINSSNNNDEKFPTFDYNPIDRKEYRSSPKRKDLEPGQLEWENKEVDKYYDGWVADHVRNSGGKIIGSNTPSKNIMNLNHGEKEKNLGNWNIITEKLLENRHNFNDDYSFLEIGNQKYKITKDAFKKISQKSKHKIASFTPSVITENELYDMNNLEKYPIKFKLIPIDGDESSIYYALDNKSAFEFAKPFLESGNWSYILMENKPERYAPISRDQNIERDHMDEEFDGDVYHNEDSNIYISNSALNLMFHKISKKKTLTRVASKFPLQSILM